MSIDNLQQTLHNRQYTIYNFPMQTYDPDKFADWLTDAYTRSKFKSFSALADAAHLSRSSVSALAGAKKQPLTDKPSQPKAETVINLAKALGEDVNKALIAGGHAPLNRDGGEFDDQVRAAFSGSDEWTDEERDDAVKFIRNYVAGVRVTRQQNQQ